MTGKREDPFSFDTGDVRNKIRELMRYSKNGVRK
jgi:hypothetical protein